MGGGGGFSVGGGRVHSVAQITFIYRLLYQVTPTNYSAYILVQRVQRIDQLWHL